MKKPYRNGDWTIIPFTGELTGEKCEHGGSFVFATGEATNHHHVISTTRLEDMTIIKLADGSYLMELKSEAVVTHPEHSLKVDLKVKPGRYVFTQRREKDWFALVTRKVID